MSWFEDWFDSPYYHTLYNNRNEEEANIFIQQLFDILDLPTQAKCLDIACGKGRHVRTMAALGYETTGIDLSPKSIMYAELQHTPNTHFFVHDMRKTFSLNEFEAVFNLFTSIGYFDTFDENFLAIQAMSSNAKAGGKIIIDFLNINFVHKNRVAHELIEKKGIEFEINRYTKENFIYKEIKVVDRDSVYQFREKVAAISRSIFEHWFKELQLKVNHVFGDYALNPFDQENSPRLIFILEK